MKRIAGLLALTFVAVPMFARVISYAPYTNRVATAAFQERTSRHFALIEATAGDTVFRANAENEVVLYDASGLDEPRVIRAKDGLWYEQVALYQKAGSAPVLLTIARETDAPNYWAIAPVVSVSVGGDVWHTVQSNLLGPFTIPPVLDVDTGGPYTHGLYAPIVLGNDTWPFVVTLGSNGVWAIGSDGVAKRIFFGNSDARVIGRNRAGDRFLVYSSSNIWSVGFEGAATRIATVDPSGAYAGWIRADGTAYIQMLRSEGRFLYATTAGTTELRFLAGPYETSPPRIGAPQQTLPTMRFFAVPTHDFEGAWIIQRETGKPTTMLKHTAAGALQSLWTDITGPQVEALIAGASGETVLVQVHREREGVELQRPFLDPALAVWRVGQGAPRSYDELYLNESWNKGFVHIDVDQIESGKTFVFNSGFQEAAPPVSRVSPPIAGGGDVIQEWGVVRGSLKQRLVLPGVARLPGAFGSFWMTDVTVYNPLDTKQQVEVRFTPLGTSDSSVTTLTLEPFEIRPIPDALKALFNLESAGGTLHFIPAVGINATARTYSRKGEGTFGFGMQAIDFFNAAGPRFPLSFAGAFPGDNFRTNMLLTDTSGRGAHVNVKGFGVSGALGTPGMGIETGAESTIQVNSVGPTVGLHSRDGGGLVVEPTRGTAITVVVAIDNRTNDPTYFPPDLPASIVRAIPVIGHLDGANGSKFRSDLYLYNPGDRTRTVTLTARKWDAPDQRTVNFTLLPHESRVIPDALKTLFGMEGVARMRYGTNDWEPGEGVRATSRTYTVEASGATYGSLVPPLNNFQIGTFGDTLEILGVSGGTGFRTNIGLVDLSDQTQRNPTVRLTIIDEKRRTVDAFTVQVPARGGMQINDIFGARGITPPLAALLKVEIIDGEQIAAYATLTDNVTNDTTYLGANLGAKPEGN
ncbi:MAG TPA: hypothetical protein VEO54_09535 [Thermoanaerobaculia bacterium]|nr:hypothetical protein [Thermoanaerobaculia bacterium]